MNMFARFDENPAMTLRVIKETKRYGRTDGRTHGHTDARTDGQRENSIPPTNKVCGGYNNLPKCSLYSHYQNKEPFHTLFNLRITWATKKAHIEFFMG